MGRIHPLNQEKVISNFDHLVEFIKVKPVVLKPVYGGVGKEVMLIDHQNGSLLCNRTQFNEENLEERIGSMDDI